jgi:hypothetical protein
VREDFQVASFTLAPLTTMAHVDRSELANFDTWGAPPFSAIIGSAVMGVMIVLIACFNLTNTAIAISSRRLKEIGIRKVMGSARKQLIIQFISETTFICLLALVVGLALTDWLIQGWNLLWDYMRLTPDYTGNPEFIAFLIGTLLVTGFLAGSYPAFYISKFNPVSILKGKVQLGGTNLYTRLLLGGQFAISIVAIVASIGLIQNARYQRDYNLGFDIRGTVLTWVNDQSEFETYRNALASNPEIKSIAGAKSGIYSISEHAPVKYKDRQSEVDIIEVGDGYLETLNLTLVKGRDFNKDSETDQQESILVTEKMASLFGWEDPIGKDCLPRQREALCGGRCERRL